MVKLGLLTEREELDDEEIALRTLKTKIDKVRIIHWRKSFIKIATHKKFDFAILFFILLSSIHIAIDHPLIDEKSNYAFILKSIDIGLTAIFTLELIIKVLAYGIFFNGPKSYLRSAWNIMDFFIVIISVTFFLIYLFYRFYHFQSPTLIYRQSKL